VADDTPFGWEPVPEVVPDVLELEPDPELQAASRPPEAPTTAIPAPTAAPRARNDRRSIGSDILPPYWNPPWTVTGTGQVPATLLPLMPPASAESASGVATA
jgi:hypothetical protein